MVLGRVLMEPAGQPPFRFSIGYDDAALKARHTYPVRATIRHRGRLLFTTDIHYPVLDGRTTPLTIQLVKVP